MIKRPGFLFRTEGDGGGAAPQPQQTQPAPQQQQQGAQPQQQQAGGFDPVMAEYYQKQGYERGFAEANSQWEAKDADRIKAQQAIERENIVTALNLSDEMKEKTKHMSLDDLKLMQEFSAGITPPQGDTPPPDAGGGVEPTQRLHPQTGLDNMSNQDIIQSVAMKYLDQGGN